MLTNDSPATRTAEFFRLLDAKDEAGLRANWVDDPQVIDEITRGWLRGRLVLEAYFHDNLPHLSDIHSTIDDVDVSTWGDVEVQTYMLRQTYVYDGTRVENRGSYDHDLAPRRRQLAGRAVPLDSAIDGAVGSRCRRSPPGAPLSSDGTRTGRPGVPSWSRRQLRLRGRLVRATASRAS